MDWTVAELIQGYRSGMLSPGEATQAALERIERTQPTFNAFATVDAEGALAAARNSEARWRRGTPIGPLDGVPTTVKDLLDVRGLPTRRGSLVTSAEPIAEDSASVARLRAAGAVLLGKTTTSEFGWKGVTDSRLTGITRHPLNPELTPGGSSGGAAVAAALGLGLLHLATDGGGSIRIPAGFCGLFGFKPTFGIVPIHPHPPAGTLWHQGALSRNVDDAIRLMQVLAQPDLRDFQSVPCPPDVFGTVDGTHPHQPLHGLTIGYSTDFGFVDSDRIEPDIALQVERAVNTLADLGAVIRPLPTHGEAVLQDPVELMRKLWAIALAVGVDSLPDSRLEWLETTVKDIAAEGAILSAVEYRHLETQRADFYRQVMAWSDGVDVVVTPQLPITAFAAGHEVPPRLGYTRWWEWSPFTYPANLTQQPAATVPVGTNDQGLPIAMQVLGRRFQDHLVLRVAKAYESFKGINLPMVCVS